jgi:capsular exopolysaccharide synthesis family protein
VELRDYLRVLRKRWRLILVCAALAVAVAGALCIRATPQYQSSTQFFVSTSAANSDPNSVYTGSLFSEARVSSYADIINGPLLAQAVASRLRGPSAATIQTEVSATAIATTVLLDVTVTDPSPQRAQEIAAAIGVVFPPIATQIEASGGQTSPVKVSVVKPATFSDVPVSPRVDRDLVLALIVGLLLGVGLAVTREVLDVSVKDPAAVQEDFGLPTLGIIAYDPEAPKRPLVVQSDPRSPRAEAFRQLRTNLQFLDVDHSPRSLVISSSIPEEGKTTTATNLAITLAQSGLRVVIVEGDLRRPRLATYLGLEGAVGLTNVLVGKVSLQDSVQRWGDGGLHVLASGPTPPNPSELLGSQGMADVIYQLEEQYDFVLIDAPPLLPVTDAAVIATAAGGAILIVRHGQTKQKQLAHAIGALRAVDATVYGIVLTMVPTKGPDAYYYGYNYKYDESAAKKKKRADTAPVAPQPGSAIIWGARNEPSGRHAAPRLSRRSAAAEKAQFPSLAVETNGSAPHQPPNGNGSIPHHAASPNGSTPVSVPGTNGSTPEAALAEDPPLDP